MAAPKNDWIELDVQAFGGDVRVSCSLSDGSQPAPITIAGGVDKLASLTAGVESAIARGEPLDQPTLAHAQALYGALFHAEIGQSVAALRSRAARTEHGPPARGLLLRLMVRDELRRFSWEALCRPDTALEFLGSSPDFLVSRGVNSPDPW